MSIGFMSKAAIGLLIVGIAISGMLFSMAPAQDEANTVAEKPEVAVAANIVAQADEAIVVPDGSPEELFAFITDLEEREVRARGQSSDTYLPYLREVKQAMLATAEKILETEPEEEALSKAIDVKLQSLRMLGLLRRVLDGGGDLDPWAETSAFVDELAADHPEQITDAIKDYAIFAKCFQTKTMTVDEAEEVVKDVKAHMLDGGIDEDDVSMARTLCAVLETPGKFELAARANRAFATLLTENGDATTAAMGESFEQTARILSYVGTKAEISGLSLDGKEVDIADYHGKVVLVDFWATWCGPCVQELPNVLQNYDSFHDQGFDVIGISLDDSVEVIKSFLADNKLPWVTLVSDASGGSGFDNELVARYEVNAIPFTMLVDREGKIYSVRVRGSELGRQLQMLIGDSKDTAARES